MSHIRRLYHCRVTNVLTNASRQTRTVLEMLVNAGEIAPAGMDRNFFQTAKDLYSSVRFLSLRPIAQMV